MARPCNTTLLRWMVLRIVVLTQQRSKGAAVSLVRYVGAKLQ